MENLRDLGLTRLEGELFGHLVLDWLYDYQEAHRGLIPSIAELAEYADRAQDIPLLRKFVEDIQQDLESRGLIKMAKVLAGPWAFSLGLTAEGRRQATHARTARKTPSVRKAACRHALLLWLYEQNEENPQDHPQMASFFGHPLSFFYGYQFEIADLDRAADWLAEIGFIQRISAWGGEALRARITTKGSDCVEADNGDIAAYIRRHQVTGGQTINVHGPNSGQIGMVGQGRVTQNQAQDIDLEAVLKAIGAVRETLPALQLEHEDEAELVRTMDEIEEKGKTGTLSEDEKNTLLTRVGSILKKSASSVGVFLLEAIDKLMN